MGSLTTNFRWPYPALTDPPNTPTDIANLANGVDATVAALFNTGQTDSGPIIGTARTTQQVFVQAGSTVVVTGAVGGFNLTFPVAFTGIRTFLVTPGDNAGGLLYITMILGNCSVTHLNGQCFGSGGSLASGNTVRINWMTIGW